MKNQKTTVNYIACGAMIAALYAGATWGCAAFGAAFGPVQLRLSEALMSLCVFTPAAVPGLAIGCLLGNISSPYGAADIVLGSAATLLAALSGRKLRNICVKGIPVLSLLMPVIFNAVFIGAEIAFFAGSQASFEAFVLAAAEIAASEAIACLVGGTVLVKVIGKSKRLMNLFNQKR